MRSDSEGTRASGPGEPYSQDANVTDAAMVKLNCRYRRDPIKHRNTQRKAYSVLVGGVMTYRGNRLTRPITIAKGCWNKVEGYKRVIDIPLPPRETGLLGPRRAGASKPLHAMRLVPSVVRHVKGSKNGT